MCRELIAAYNESTGKLLVGVGSHSQMFADAGVSSRRGWITAQSSIANGPGDYMIETDGKVSSKALKKITDFFGGLGSDPENLIGHIREYGWDYTFVNLLTSDAQRTYTAVENSLNNAYSAASRPVEVEIDSETAYGTIRVTPNVSKLHKEIVDVPLVEVFASLFRNGMNRANAWKQMGKQ